MLVHPKSCDHIGCIRKYFFFMDHWNMLLFWMVLLFLLNYVVSSRFIFVTKVTLEMLVGRSIFLHEQFQYVISWFHDLLFNFVTKVTLERLFSSWTDVICLFKPIFREKLWSQRSHLKGFFSAWTLQTTTVVTHVKFLLRKF